jgi:hypothetical protein
MAVSSDWLGMQVEPSLPAAAAPSQSTPSSGLRHAKPQ